MTYRAPHAHQEEEDDLLPWREGAEVDGGEAADGDGGDAVEEGVDIADVVFAVACIEYARGD